MREQTVLTPSQVGQYIKQWMDRDRLLSGLLISGEISNYKVYPSGHHYFTLKDGEGALRCVMFRGDAASLRFRPSNGMRVIAAGRITVFPRDGQYQLYCVRLTPEGVGDLHLAFEQLKERLAREGLFDPAHKRPLPRFPSTVALITSPAGAAVRDMVRILGARWPLARIRVLPVRVQGEGAAEEIAAALQWANENRVADVIITGRGGGSMEDLWAATPSNAAELAVPDQNEIYGALLGDGGRLRGAITFRLDRYRQALDRLATSRPMREPASYWKDKRLLLDYQSRQLCHGFERCLAGRREELARLSAALDAMSPLRVLARGYAVARGEGGQVVSSVEQVRTGERLELTLSDGTLDCQVL